MPWVDGDYLTPTNLNAKSGQVYNVQDAAYGATGDGSTDDTAAIKSALTTAEAAGGGIVFVPPGVYMLSSGITIPNRVRLVGAGEGGTPTNTGGAPVLRADSSFSDDFLVANAQRDGTQEFAWIERIGLHGSKNSGALCTAGLLFKGLYVNSAIQDVVIQECSGYGLQISSDTATIGLSGPIPVDNVWVIRNGSHNIYCDGPLYSIHLNNVTSEYPGVGKECLFFDGPDPAQALSHGHSITNFVSEWTAAGSHAIRLNNVSGTLVHSANFIFVSGSTTSNNTCVRIEGGASAEVGPNISFLNLRTRDEDIPLLQDTISGITLSGVTHCAYYSTDTLRVPKVLTNQVAPLSGNTITQSATSLTGVLLAPTIALGSIANKDRLQVNANASQGTSFRFLRADQNYGHIEVLGISLTSGRPPAANNSSGSQGQLAYDAGFLYVCASTDSWLRVALTDF